MEAKNDVIIMAYYSDKKFVFSESKLKSLKPQNKNFIIYDSKESGLGLSISSTGIKSYVFYKKVNGKPKRKVIGKFKELPLAEARLKVLKYKQNIAIGSSLTNITSTPAISCVANITIE